VEPGQVTFTYDEQDARLILKHDDEPEQEMDVRAKDKHTLPAGQYLVRPVVERKNRRLLPNSFFVKPGEPMQLELRLVGEISQVAWQSRPVRAVALVARKNRLLALSGSDDSTVQVWDAFNEKDTQILEYDKPNPVQCLAFSRDGRSLLVGGGGKGRPGSKAPIKSLIHLWNLDNLQQPVASFVVHERKVTGLAVHPDGQRFLSAADDGQLYLWDLQKHEVLWKTQAHEQTAIDSVAYSQDGRQALTGGGNSVLILWDAETGKQIKPLKGHTEAIRGVAFAPDGREAASASFDGSIRIWDLKAGSSREIRGH
jgi:WD40 repeat protein